MVYIFILFLKNVSSHRQSNEAHSLQEHSLKLLDEDRIKAEVTCINCSSIINM